MKLNEAGKDEVRKLIEELVKEVPEGQKIKLSKDVLEGLIFSPIYYKDSIDKDSIEANVPIWTGPFLRKIDLSELNMVPEGVLYSKVYCAEKIKNLGIPLPQREYLIDFSYTNIDCHDLFRRKNELIYFSGCNFEGVDLSYVTLYLGNFDKDTLDLSVMGDCNFRNTGLRIVTKHSEHVPDNYFSNFSYNQYNNFHFDFLDNYDSEYADEIEENLFIPIRKGCFDGCYIDGYLIQNGKVTAQKVPERKEDIKQEYEKFKDQILSDLRNNIEGQIAAFGEDDSPKSGGISRK